MIPPDDKIVLTVLHNIFLTRKERYDLIEGESITTMGVSVPVWVLHKSGKSTEPASEVFCEYQIINDKESGKSVKKIPKGYAIRLPQLEEEEKPAPSLEEWIEMSKEEQKTWYEENKKPPHPGNLRDITDGGSEYLRFEQQRKAKFNNGPYIHILHWVEIKGIEALNKTILTR